MFIKTKMFWFLRLMHVNQSLQSTRSVAWECASLWCEEGAQLRRRTSVIAAPPSRRWRSSSRRVWLQGESFGVAGRKKAGWLATGAKLMALERKGWERSFRGSGSRSQRSTRGRAFDARASLNLPLVLCMFLLPRKVRRPQSRNTSQDRVCLLLAGVPVVV